MQNASQGLRTLGRKAPNVAGHNKQGIGSHNIGATRNISTFHRVWGSVRDVGQTLSAPISSISSVSAAQTASHAGGQAGLAHRLFSQGRNLASKVVAQLVAPGLAAPLPTSGASASRYHGFARGGMGGIKQNLSFPVRTALSRPLIQQRLFLPQAPVVPRHIAEVGLGTARKFSTARPIFQHLVDNVPVVGRAFLELDWEERLKEERENMRNRRKSRLNKLASGAAKEQVPIKGKELAKVSEKKEKKYDHSLTLDQTEVEKYFSEPAVAGVTTYLMIPLAPTPTGRQPLPRDPCDLPFTLFPLPTLANIHNDHERHSMRVSTLFSRLDRANVWQRGVQCSAYSHLYKPSQGGGVCSVLRVEFTGWTKAQVKEVIGESGEGWCVLEEVPTGTAALAEHRETEYDSDTADSMVDSLSGISTPSTFLSGSGIGMDDWDMGDMPFNSSTSTVETARAHTDPEPLMLDLSTSAFESNMEREASRTGIEYIDPAESFILPRLDFSSMLDARATSAVQETPPAMEQFSPGSEKGFDPWSEPGSPSITEASFVSENDGEGGGLVHMSGFFGFSSHFDAATNN